MSNKQGKMAGYINYRMRVTLMDGRQMTGQMLAFDKHMNLVLADTEEFRRVKRKQTKPTAPGASSSAATQTIETEEKRTLGLTILRGAHIVSLSVESAPPADPSTRLGKSTPSSLPTGLSSGPGISRPAGRGVAPSSLAGPAAGVGGSAPPPFPQFGGAPGFGPGRGGPPAPGFPPGGFPPPGFPQNTQFPPPGFNPAGGAPPGFNPPPRR
ncbi:Sm-like ribonucleoprotein [Annulohypoxylon bovei var. microspora]|nr:Sm-like ribonucleoprotein [Annulohypoxylon bovei var. microspora]